ncbi:MAG: hypothetical protein RRA94_08760 [Bacteroidota bacterium]|nr:hypothetical protein [Bacteroidota bacterium]
MNDRTLFVLLYFATPVTLVFGLAIMYLLIGDHPWFTSMAIGYTVLLAVLYVVKISMFRKLLRKKPRADSEASDG